MNGIEKITQRIASQAQAEIDGVLEQARDEAARIIASYRAQAEAEARRISSSTSIVTARRPDLSV